MPDWVVITIGVVIAVGAAIGCAAVINRVKQRPDALQLMLNRNPLFGKDFFSEYYPDLPRRIVFDVRAEFATLIGVPSDFVRPEDSLAAYTSPESAEAMRGYLTLLVGSIRGPEFQAEIPQQLATLDDYIRAAATLTVTPTHASSEVPSALNASVDKGKAPDSVQSQP